MQNKVHMYFKPPLAILNKGRLSLLSNTAVGTQNVPTPFKRAQGSGVIVCWG